MANLGCKGLSKHPLSISPGVAVVNLPSYPDIGADRALGLSTEVASEVTQGCMATQEHKELSKRPISISTRIAVVRSAFTNSAYWTANPTLQPMGFSYTVLTDRLRVCGIKLKVIHAIVKPQVYRITATTG